MKASYLILGVVLVLILGVSAYFLLNNSRKSERSELSAPSSSQIEDGSSPQLTKDSRYIEYSRVNLENNSGKRRVLYFYANWCPTCRPADENFKQNESKIPEDLVLIRVNYNDADTDEEEKALAQKYDITYQHTFVQIDAKGNEVTKWNGGQINELLSNIK